MFATSQQEVLRRFHSKVMQLSLLKKLFHMKIVLHKKWIKT
jgi:hypothetical protein